MPVILHNDLDGIVSGMLACRVSKIIPDNENKFLVVNYEDDRDEKFKHFLGHQLLKTGSLIENREDTWFVDTSLRQGELDWARNKPLKKSKWFWTDHHESSKEFEQGDLFFNVVLDIKKSASILMLEKITTLGKINSSDNLLAEWAMVADKRDMWTFAPEEKSDLMKLSFIVKEYAKPISSTNPDSFAYLIRKMQKMGYKQLIDEHKGIWEKEIVEYEKSLKFAENTIASLGKSLVIKICYCKGYESDLADDLLDKNNNEMIVFIKQTDDSFTMSFRKTNICNTDLSEVGKLFNGGGHKYASGGKMDVKAFAGGYAEINNRIMQEVNRQEKQASLNSFENNLKVTTKKLGVK